MYGASVAVFGGPSLYRIDKIAGTSTLVGQFKYTDFPGPGVYAIDAMPDISFAANGDLYGVAQSTGGVPELALGLINKATARVTRIGNTGLTRSGGITGPFGGNGFDINKTTGIFYLAHGTGLFTIDGGGTATLLGLMAIGDHTPIPVDRFGSLAWNPLDNNLYGGYDNGFLLAIIDVGSQLVRCIAEDALPVGSTVFDAICWDGTPGPPPFPPSPRMTFGDTYFELEGVGRGAGAIGGGGGGSISGGGGGSTGGGTGGTGGGTGGGPGGGPSGGGGGTPTGAGVGTIRWGGSYVLGTPGYTDMDVFNVDLNRLTAPAELPGQVVFYRSACSVHTAYDSSIPVGSASLLRDSGGNLLVNSQFSSVGDQCYILDVSDPAMSTALGNACVNWCSTYNFNGIWMDDVVFWGTSLLNALPAGWSQAQWASRLAAHVRRVAKIIRDAGYQIACNSNGFIPGDSPGSDNGDNELAWWTTLITPAAANELSPTGLTPEYWMQSPGNITQVRTKGAAFYQFWDGWRRLHPFCHTNGIDFIPVSYATADDDACIYIRASQLLDFNGTGVLYSGTETAVPFGPIWCKDPGAPTSAATETSSGVWRRTFANTTVTVDTNSGFASISGGGGPTSPFGGSLPTRMPESSGSTTIIVSPSGNDSTGTGSLANPYKTMPKALAVATDGALIQFRGGDYTSTSASDFISEHVPGFSPSNPVTLMSYPGETAVIRGTSDDSYVNNWFIGDTQGIRLRKLEFARGGGVGVNVIGLKIYGCINVEIDQCYVHDIATSSQNGQGILVGGDNTYGRSEFTKNFQCWNSHFFNICPGAYNFSSGHGLYLAEVDGGVLANNIIHALGAGTGSQLYPHCLNFIVANNTYHHFTSTDIYCPAIYISMLTTPPAASANNTIVNNLFIDAKHCVASSGDAMSGNFVDYNMDYDISDVRYPNVGPGMYSLGSHNVTADPKFVAPGSDYHLQDGSPAKGGGNPAYTPSKDHYGTARTTADLGAVAA